MSKYSFEIPVLFAAFLALGIAGNNDVEDAELTARFEKPSSVETVKMPTTYEYYKSYADEKGVVDPEIAFCRASSGEAKIADVASNGEAYFASTYGHKITINDNQKTCSFKDLTFRITG